MAKKKTKKERTTKLESEIPEQKKVVEKLTHEDKILEAKLARGFIQIVAKGKSAMKNGEVYLVSKIAAEQLVARGLAEYKE